MLPGTAMVRFSDDGIFERNRFDDPSQLIFTLSATDLVGIVTLLYSTLLHSGAPPRADGISPSLMSQRTVSVVMNGLRVLNHTALLHLPMLQVCVCIYIYICTYVLYIYYAMYIVHMYMYIYIYTCTYVLYIIYIYAYVYYMQYIYTYALYIYAKHNIHICILHTIYIHTIYNILTESWQGDVF